MTASALKKLPLTEEQLSDDQPVPAKAPEHPATQPVMLKPVGQLIHEGFSSPGLGWECIRQPQLGEYIRKGLFHFNPAKARLGELETAATWAALTRWENNAEPLPPRAPQGEEAIWPQPCRNGVTYIAS